MIAENYRDVKERIQRACEKWDIDCSEQDKTG